MTNEFLEICFLFHLKERSKELGSPSLSYRHRTGFVQPKNQKFHLGETDSFVDKNKKKNEKFHGFKFFLEFFRRSDLGLECDPLCQSPVKVQNVDGEFGREIAGFTTGLKNNFAASKPRCLELCVSMLYQGSRCQKVKVIFILLPRK